MNHQNYAAKAFPSHIWRSLAAGRPPILCPPGFLIYIQQSQATCFYYLKQGRVKSFLQSEAGGERVLKIYETGSLFGAASFFDELPRVSSAVAMTQCSIVPIDRELVRQEIQSDPELALAMMKELARTVRHLSAQVDQMAFRPARWRLAYYLLSRVQEDGIVHASHEEIAQSISTSRITVSRIVSEFCRAGWLESGYRGLRILELAPLQAMCED